jgi:phage shock protein PspC (stress-responsive transcriptional regulator)
MGSFSPMGDRKLYRSRTDRLLAGVCGGMAEYFGLRPLVVRILWVIAVLPGGIGILAYILFWLLTPEEPITD